MKLRSAISRQMSIVLAAEMRQPDGHGGYTCERASPVREAFSALSNFASSPAIMASDAVGAYEQLCMSMINGMFLASFPLPCVLSPIGVVEVHEPKVVELDDCIPVFI